MSRRFLLAVGLGLYVALTSGVQAAVDDYRPATWNLQGSSASSESKWNVNVRAMVSSTSSDYARVLAIQEAGDVPSSAQLQPRLGTAGGVPLSNPGNLQIPVEEYRWNLGTSGRPIDRYIYFSRTDTGANRVNLALVTDTRADEVVILRSNNFPALRPTIGVRFGDDYFFTLHASASGGGDGPALVDAVSNYVISRRSSAQWMVLGDFNRNPNSFQLALFQQYPTTHALSRMVTQNHPTHRPGSANQTERNLDYAVVGSRRSATLAAMRFVAGLGNQLASDHVPVRFK